MIVISGIIKKTREQRMKTYKYNARNSENQIDEKQINCAAVILKNGGTVAFPTETVYGLGANALDEDAIKKIFKAKGRPSDNPLIVHIADTNDLMYLTDHIPQKASQLIKDFWPGPLTIIFEKKENISPKVTGNLPTIAIRMPSNEVALALIKKSGVPVAAPSANISGKPSPTKAEHVVEDLYGRVDGIVIGEDCEVGLESTVIDLTVEPPIILRPGLVTKEEIEESIGCVCVDHGIESKTDEAPKAPGMKYTHYSPKAKVIVFEGDITNIINKINEIKEVEEKEGYIVGVLASEETSHHYSGHVMTIGSREKMTTVAKLLFHALRSFDKTNVDIILAESFDKEGIGLAVMNRMIKSAGYNIIHVGSE